jgi:hypothetical protein
MRKTSNNNILHFQKNINKQKTTKSFKTFFIKNLLILILFMLFFWEGKIEVTIKTINKNGTSFELKFKLTHIKREEDPLSIKTLSIKNTKSISKNISKDARFSLRRLATKNENNNKK